MRRRTSVLTSARRQQGTITSASLTPLSDSREFEVEVRLEPADVADGTLFINLSLEASFDGGLSWTTFAGSTWQGGLIGRDGNPIHPRIGYRSNHLPNRARLALDLPRSVVCSADIIEAASESDPR